MQQPQTITLPLEQAQAIRAYLGSRPHDEVALACFWLDLAMQPAPETPDAPEEGEDS